MSYWLRAVDDYAMVSCANRRVVVLHPGQACAFDYSAQHDGVIAEIRAGRSPLELVEADVDPSLAPPPPDEPELERERAEHNARARAAAHTRLRAADAPPLPDTKREGWTVVTPAAEEPPTPVDEVRRLKPEEIPADLAATTTQED